MDMFYKVVKFYVLRCCENTNQFSCVFYEDRTIKNDDNVSSIIIGSIEWIAYRFDKYGIINELLNEIVNELVNEQRIASQRNARQ